MTICRQWATPNTESSQWWKPKIFVPVYIPVAVVTTTHHGRTLHLHILTIVLMMWISIQYTYTYCFIHINVCIKTQGLICKKATQFLQQIHSHSHNVFSTYNIPDMAVSHTPCCEFASLHLHLSQKVISCSAWGAEGLNTTVNYILRNLHTILTTSTRFQLPYVFFCSTSQWSLTKDRVGQKVWALPRTPPPKARARPKKWIPKQCTRFEIDGGHSPRARESLLLAFEKHLRCWKEAKVP